MTLTASGASLSLDTIAGPLIPCGPNPYLYFRKKELPSLAACYAALFSSPLSLLIFFTRYSLNVARSSLFFFAIDGLLHAASFLSFADLYSLLRLVGLFFLLAA